MTTRIKLRRDTAINWLSINPILAAGEPGLETDTGKIKYGDGTTAWELLKYGGSDTLVDDGSVLISAGSANHWVATQRRDNYDTEPRGVRYDSEGNLYTLTKANASGPDIGIITKYTDAGAVTWQKSITDFNPVTLAVDSNDCAYVTGDIDSPTITIIKFSSTGIILWKKDYDIGPILASSAFIEEKSSSTLAVAYTINDPPNDEVVMEIRTSDGSVLIKKLLAQEIRKACPCVVSSMFQGQWLFV
jgi:DNA-directed RNA polymerase subunit L